MPVINHMVATVGQCDGPFGWRAHRADHRCPQCASPGRKNLPHAARGCVHQNDIARLHSKQPVQQVFSRHAAKQGGGGGLQRQAIGQWQGSLCWNKSCASIGARMNISHRLTDHKAADAWPYRFHDARALRPEHHRKMRRAVRAGCACALVHVGKIQTNRALHDAQFARAGVGNFNFRKFENVWATVAMDDDGRGQQGTHFLNHLIQF